MSIISTDRDNKTKEWIKALFQTYEAGLNGQKSQPISAFKRAAYDQLMEERFPTRRIRISCSRSCEDRNDQWKVG